LAELNQWSFVSCSFLELKLIDLL